MVKQHARDIEQREKDLDHREAALDERRATEVSILAAAERRDAEAEARDVVADDRERAADLKAFLGTDPGYVEGLPARRHAAQGRLGAKADRAHSANDRDKLTEDCMGRRHDRVVSASRHYRPKCPANRDRRPYVRAVIEAKLGP